MTKYSLQFRLLRKKYETFSFEIKKKCILITILKENNDYTLKCFLFDILVKSISVN